MRSIVVLCVLAFAGREACLAQDLTGIWTADDGGTYQIRHAGVELWWYGVSARGGGHWQNVFRGVLTGPGLFEGSWADLPPSGARGSGLISVRYEDGVLRRVTVTGGFGGSVWRRGGAVKTCQFDLSAATSAVEARSGGRSPQATAAKTPDGPWLESTANVLQQVMEKLAGVDAARSYAAKESTWPEASDPFGRVKTRLQAIEYMLR